MIPFCCAFLFVKKRPAARVGAARPMDEIFPETGAFVHDREEPANIFPAGRQTKSIGKQLRKKFLFKGLMIMTLTDKKKGRQKPVVMLIVDTLLDPPLREAIKQNKAPAFQFLMERGMYFPDVVTAFPAMSVNVDTTLLTGTYCDRHHVPGLAWFSAEENRLINYGTGYRELYKLGVSRSLNDTLFQLNNRHISKHVQTIHEALKEQGKSSASINALIFRGPAEKKFRFPTWTNFFVPLAKKQPVKGTDLFTYGAFQRISPSKKHQSIWKKFGFNSHYAVGEFIYLLKHGLLPKFTIVYLPELDKRVHKYGRMDVQGVVMADQFVQKILNAFPSWEQALEHCIWITMGDNGQAHISADRQQALIDLRKIFAGRRIMKLKKGVRTGDEIVLAVNQRMAYVYTLKEKILPVRELAEVLAGDSRIDVIAWKEGDAVEVRSGERAGALRFQKGGAWNDVYGQSWHLEGNPEILDLTVNGNKISFGDYPDALARLHSSLHSHLGHFVIANAAPGSEFIGESSPNHVGGAAHGGLHRDDSLIPMIVNGTEKRPDYPEWSI